MDDDDDDNGEDDDDQDDEDEDDLLLIPLLPSDVELKSRSQAPPLSPGRVIVNLIYYHICDSTSSGLLDLGSIVACLLI